MRVDVGVYVSGYGGVWGVRGAGPLSPTTIRPPPRRTPPSPSPSGAHQRGGGEEGVPLGGRIFSAMRRWLVRKRSEFCTRGRKKRDGPHPIADKAEPRDRSGSLEREPLF